MTYKRSAFVHGEIDVAILLMFAFSHGDRSMGTLALGLDQKSLW